MIRYILLCLCLAHLPTHADDRAKPKTLVDPNIAALKDPDFLIQGEYCCEKMGAQVVALGAASFDVYLLEGGLPGAGWEPGKSRKKLSGGMKEGKIEVRDEAGKTMATLSEGSLFLTNEDGKTQKLLRVDRKSPTLGVKPAAGAVVLFDGTNADEWVNGKVVDGHLQATNATSKRTFGDYKLHLEFRTPYMPAARGQGRGNSGIYHGGRWETQILDSFGLEGLDNETGGIYSLSKPRLNMCLPPLAWQTYDVDLTAAKFNAEGKRTAWPRITVRLNGVTIHDDLELTKDFTASAPLSQPLTSPEGPVFLQDHGNPVEFRNIWIIPGK